MYNIKELYLFFVYFCIIALVSTCDIHQSIGIDNGLLYVIFIWSYERNKPKETNV